MLLNPKYPDWVLVTGVDLKALGWPVDIIAGPGRTSVDSAWSSLDETPESEKKLWLIGYRSPGYSWIAANIAGAWPSSCWHVVPAKQLAKHMTWAVNLESGPPIINPWPGFCDKCKAPAYVSAMFIECSKRCCKERSK